MLSDMFFFILTYSLSYTHSITIITEYQYDYFWFLSHISMHMHAEQDIVMANVRPSVPLSVTLWYCVETYAHIVKLFPRPVGA